MNKKGQALVEFVIILPVLLMILFVMIDFGLIIYNKNKLENKINDVVEMISNNESDEDIKSFINEGENKKTTYKVIEGENKTIKLFTSVNIITPGLNIVLDNPYKIEVSRVIYDE